MKHCAGVLIMMWSLFSIPAGASVEIPLVWKSVSIQSDDRGGASLEAATGADGELEQLAVTIRGKRVAIPPRCLQGLERPYLNGIRLAYGRSASGQSLWSLEIPYDGTGSVALESDFHLLFTETDLISSYQAVQIDERTTEDREVCPLDPVEFSPHR